MANNFPPNNDDDAPDWLLGDDQDNASDDLSVPDIDWGTPANQQSSTGDQGVTLKGMTGKLPWNAQASGDPNAPAGDDLLPDIDWDQSAAKTGADTGDSGISLKGMTGTLPWNALASEGAPPSGDDMLSFLDTTEQPAVQIPNTPPPAAAPPQAGSLNIGASDDDAYSFDDVQLHTGMLHSRNLPGDESLDWLSDDPSALSGAPTGASDDFGFAETSDTPEWLQETAAPAEDAPNWLSDMSAPAAASDDFGFAETSDTPEWLQESTAPAEDAPNWLSDMSAPAEVSNNFGFAETSDTPEWLQESTAPAEDAPNWLSDMNAPAAASDDFGFAETSDTPEWLQETAAPTEDAPNWLSDMSAPAEASDNFGFAETSDTPEWLQETAAPAEDADFAESTDIPEWLLDDDEPVAAETSADLPDWMAGSAEPAIASDFAFGEETAAVDDSLPDWMRGSAEPAETSAATSDFAFGDEPVDDMSDWMSGAAQPPPPAAPARAAAPSTYGDTDFDSLFADDQPQEEPLEPAPWGISAPDDLTYSEWERLEDEKANAANKPPKELEEVPDWFLNADQGAAPVEAAAGGDYIPEWFMGVEELNEDDAPEWLKSSRSTPAAPPPPPPAQDIELPDLDAMFGAPAEQPSSSIRRLAPKPADTPPTEAVSLDDLFGEEEPVTLDMPGTDELDWLLDDTPEEAAAAPALELPGTGDLNWMNEPVSTAASGMDDFDSLFGTETAAPAMEMPGTGDLDWMNAPVLEESPALELPGTGDLDWMNAAPEAEAIAEEGTPDWLKGYAPEESIIEETPAPAEEEINWLENLGGMDFSAPAPTPPPAPAPAKVQAGLPPADPLDFDDIDLDSLLGTTDLTVPSPNLPVPVGDLNSYDAMSFEEEDIFRDFAPSAPAATAGEAEDIAYALPDDEELELAEGAALPEWMSGVTASTDTVTLRVGGVEARLEQVPLVVLPPDLRVLRDHMGEHLMRALGAQPTASQGPLAGIDGALPHLPELAKPGQLAAFSRSMQGLTDTQELRLGSLQRILEIVQAETAKESIKISYGLDDDFEDEVIDTAPKAAPRKRVKRQTDRMLISLVLLVLIVLPFLSDALHLAPEPPDTLNAEAAPLGAAIDTLAALGDERVPVLVAFEYAPTAAQELDPLVEAVLRDLLAKGGKPVAVSTNPIGMLHARQVLDHLGADEALLAALNREEALVPAEDYVVLPLLAGGAIGVRSLANGGIFTAAYFTRDVSGNDTGLEIDTVQDTFPFVIVVGERPEDTQIWAEQFEETGLPMFALVTSSAEPLTRAYYSAGTYDGLLSGIQGTLMYNSARNQANRSAYDGSLPDPALSRWHSAVLGTTIATLVIIGGMLINLIRAFRRRRA